jgi:hypothetical protein
VKSCRAVWQAAPRVRHTLLLLLAVEVLAAAVLPAVVPRRAYFSLYESDPRARASLEAFLNDQGALVPDPVTGWRNRPEFVHDKWVTDEYGSRSPVRLPVERTGAKRRVLFLGSSKVNGGMALGREETIAAYLADEGTETLNFGTMLYGIDQSILAYKRYYARFQPDVVVIGVDPRAHRALGNIYVPLVAPTEVNMPFVKPRFTIVDGRLQRIDPPLELLRRSLNDPDPLLDFLSRYDEDFETFDNYRHFGMTPVAAGLNYSAGKLAALRAVLGSQPAATEKILATLLERFRDELAVEHRHLLLLTLPDEDVVRAAFDWQPVVLMHRRQCRMLAASHLDVVDMLPTLRAHRREPVYSPDGAHFSALGNRIIAGALAAHLARIAAIPSTPASPAADGANHPL